MQNKPISSNKTLRAGNRLLSLEVPLVAGIINVTPDSFFDGSRAKDVDAALKSAEKMISEGASILDVGGYSTRPGATEIDEEEELIRVIPVVTAIVKQFPDVVISVDTFRSTVAAHALESGAVIINDVTAGTHDGNMLSVVAQNKATCILMHMRGTPSTMGELTEYKNVVTEVASYLNERSMEALRTGVTEIILDPGFGFAKTAEQNFTMLRNFHHFTKAGFPLLAGLSRKSMIWRTLKTEPANALNGTTALNMAALIGGASILRVHDVKEAIETVTLFKELKGNPTIQIP